MKWRFLWQIVNGYAALSVETKLQIRAVSLVFSLFRGIIVCRKKYMGNDTGKSAVDRTRIMVFFCNPRYDKESYRAQK